MAANGKSYAKPNANLCGVMRLSQAKTSTPIHGRNAMNGSEPKMTRLIAMSLIAASSRLGNPPLRRFAAAARLGEHLPGQLEGHRSPRELLGLLHDDIEDEEERRGVRTDKTERPVHDLFGAHAQALSQRLVAAD